MKKKKLSVTSREGVLVLMVSLFVTFGLLLSTHLVGADETIPLPALEKLMHVSPSVKVILNTERPPKGKPKLGSSLNQLLEVKRGKDPAEARAFSVRHNMVMEDSRVQVIIVTSEDAIDEVREAVAMMGGEHQLHYQNLLQAMIPSK